MILAFFLACAPGGSATDSGVPDSGDTGDTAGPDDTAHTGETGDTGDSGDTGDTAADDLCTQSLPTDPPGGPDCLTGPLACGDTVEATTEGGASDYVAADYTHLFCFVPSGVEGFTGTERAWRVDLEASVNATLTVESPCAEVGVAVMRWGDEETCPTSEDNVTVCEGKVGEGTLTVPFGGFPSVNGWVVVVDTAAADPAPVRLTLTCD